MALIGSLLGVLGPAVHAISAAAVTNPCGPPVVNAIACENTLPGDPPADWQVTGTGDATIQGFATDQSINAGQTMSFKISTPVNSYHIDILRLGWYQGNGARKVAAALRPSVTLPQTQPSCLVDNTNTTGLIDCGNWAVSASWTAPATAVSGVYAAHLVRDDTGGDSLILFNVRNDASHSNIVYQTTDVAREAYNQYGGNSLYTCTVACPTHNPAPLVYSSAYKVSFNRPLADPLQESFFDAEYPMVQFLEQNGYDVSYISGVDTDRAGALLTNHKVFISSGHDEYWSAGQRTNVQAARDAGVSLAFFSGNEMFWKVRYENSIDGTSTADRTLVSYKDTHFPSPVDPLYPAVTTGTWRDPRYSPPADSGQPENGLTGTAYMVDPPATFPLEVPAAYAKLRLWRNTSVASLTAGQVATLAPDTLGYEFDEDLDNGFRPAGLIDLSSTTESVPHVLRDYGSTESAGLATHHLTMYRAASGALVFGAGTVQWSYGLEVGHNPSTDGRMQQATVNLFADMGAQPSTLISGLVTAISSSDTSPPTSTITSPSPGTVIADGTSVTISGTASDTGGGQVAGVEVSTDGGATWHPASGTTSWTYRWDVASYGPATIKARATDDSGNIEAPSAGIATSVTCPCQLFPTQVSPATTDAGDSNAVEVGVKFTTTTDGWATGVRFYKSAANTGTHIGNLWSAGGQLLASATFGGESASGWQQVTFSQAVHLSPNTVYVASYHTNVGHYSADAQAFSGKVVNSPPLVGLQSGTDTSATTNVSGPNGVFAYSTRSTFPTQAFNDTNYWVDVTFLPTAGAPFVVGETPAPLATNQSTTPTVAATFSQDVVPSSIAFSLTGPGNISVPASIGYDAVSHTATLSAISPLTPNTTYTATVSNAQTAQGSSMTGPATWTFSTFNCPCSLWNATTVPASSDTGDPSAVELGVQFTPQVNGYVYGLRFYKSTANTGSHVGSLWTSAGDLLARATFQNETATGWQQLTFASPVPVIAGTTYTTSYHTNVGHYSANGGYFTADLISGPLDAPSNGHNGVYAYSNASTFPTNSFNNANYWVDPVFDIKPSNDTSPPTVSTTTPATGATGVPVSIAVSATFSKPVQPGSVSFTLVDPNNHTVQATYAYNVSTFTGTITPAEPLLTGTTYTAAVSAALDLAGHPMSGPFSWIFTTVQPTCPCTLWPASAVPAVTSADDTSALELGTRFQPDRNGYITGIRFYKGSGNSGTHIGDLWSNTGQLLATGVFVSETATGWQELDFLNAVTVTAGATYVVSYHTDTGHYAYTSNYFGSQYDNSPLHAPAANNGVYTLGGSSFPTQSYNATNYWVDAVFNTTGTPRTTPPVVTGFSPTSGATGVALTPTLTATFDEEVRSPNVDFALKDSSNNAVSGTQTYDVTTNTASFVPAAPLSFNATYTASVRATDYAGNAMTSPVTWSFTVAGPTCPCSIWNTSTIPSVADSGDTTAYELGVKFKSDFSGSVTGVRFYKSAANTGIHIGSLWSSTGQLLASANFTNETASGWQAVTFTRPVAITAGTVYVASYHTNVGRYSYDSNYFSTAGADNAPLHALPDGTSGGNGVFLPGGTSAFPNQTYHGNNYWVDVVLSIP